MTQIWKCLHDRKWLIHETSSKAHVSNTKVFLGLKKKRILQGKNCMLSQRLCTSVEQNHLRERYERTLAVIYSIARHSSKISQKKEILQNFGKVSCEEFATGGLFVCILCFWSEILRSMEIYNTSTYKKEAQ
jgi:hypothetical protein